MKHCIYSRRFFLEKLSLTIIGMIAFHPKIYSTYTKRMNLILDNKNDDLSRINKMLKYEQSLIWLFTGNSITQGAKHTHGMRSFSEIFAERIRWEMQRKSDFVINTGVSGSTTLQVLNDFDKRIAQFNPKVVILMIGTNDAAEDRNITLKQYRQNLTDLTQRIREIGAIPILLSPNTIIIEKSLERGRLAEYVVMMKDVALHEDVIFVDNWNIWSTDLQIKYNGRVFKELLNDPLHPNGLGHQEIAVALFKELSIFDPNAPTCGGVYYEGYH